MENIRVAFVIESFLPDTGGGENSARMLANKLTEKGCNISVISKRFDSKNPALNHIKVISCGFSKLLDRILFALHTAWIVRSKKFNIVFSFGKSFSMDIYRPGGGVHTAYKECNLSSYHRKIYRMCQAFRDAISPEQWFLSWVENKQYSSRRLKIVVAVSNMLKRHIRKWYKIDGRRIEVIHNGVDIERFSPNKKENTGAVVRRELHLLDEVIVLFVANNFRLKGLRTLLLALASLEGSVRESVRLLVVGKGKEKRWKQLASMLGVDKNVLFLGMQKNIESIYSASDIFVFPSFYDPCANVCLEALASGLPVISSSSNGSSEIIEEGKQGYVIKDPSDYVSFASKMNFLIKNRKTRIEMGAKARKLAEKYSIESRIDIITSLIKFVASRNEDNIPR